MGTKDTKDINVTREWVKLFLGIGLAIFGMGIIAYSLVVPPTGAIHASVVTTFGTILTWMGAMFGFDSNGKIRKHEIDMEYEIKKKELDDKMKRFDLRHSMTEVDIEKED